MHPVCSASTAPQVAGARGLLYQDVYMWRTGDMHESTLQQISYTVRQMSVRSARHVYACSHAV